MTITRIAQFTAETRVLTDIINDCGILQTIAGS